MDVFDHEGRSALHLAAEHGSIEVCEALLNKNGKYINTLMVFTENDEKIGHRYGRGLFIK